MTEKNVPMISVASPESEKMAPECSRLLSELAHEINNPNNFAYVSAQNMEYRLKELKAFIDGFIDETVDDDIRKAFDDRFKSLFSQLSLVKEGSQQVTAVVSRIRERQRGGTVAFTLLDPVALLLSTLGSIENVHTDIVFDKEKLTLGSKILGDYIGLKQIFTNLLVNACHAIEAKRSAGNPSAAASTGSIVCTSSIEHQELRLVILDNGCGMSEEVISRIFEDFFTTKAPDKGTGLGMSICKSLVDAHHGRLEVESRLGEGTRLTLSFPLAPQNT